MAKLILSMDGLVLKEISLTKERTTIGRKPHNDIQIDNLAISGEHAVIVTILNDSFLEDLGSTNGTCVNGQQVSKHFLQNGDVIELGKYRLKYVNEVPQQAGAGDFEKTMILRPDMLRKAAEPVLDRPAAPDIAPPPAPAPAAPAAPAPSTPTAEATGLPLGAIQILNGANAGRSLELVKTLTTLGKPGVQVAVISRRPQGYFITHVEGSSFPVLNGKSLDAQAHPLSSHDIIELAGVKMEFFLKG
ncbi:MAG: FHA domain-containing protein [Proteobacteria bacterium]|nr:FHA domain-containing protein [Pseudomonadota bacterium]HQR03985.1 FHA domain-containing protein [Rhodocyclaceae bacterium]